jgi:predicted metalloendopeptidase
MRLVFAAARLVVALTICAGSSLLAAHATAARTGTLAGPFDPGAMDRSISACSDFFGYATGRYRATHPVPPAYSEYGYEEELVDRTRDVVRSILAAAQRRPGAANGDTQKMGAFYGSCMKTAAIERRGTAPLAAEFARVAAIARPDDLPAALAHLHAIGVDAGFALNPTQDIRDSSRIIAEIDQDGMGLPDRDYYVRGDRDSVKLRAQYQAYVATMLRLGGDRTAAADARAVVALETRFARASKSTADLREPSVTYHPMSLKRAMVLAPHANFVRYLSATDLQTGTLNVAEPAFVRAFDRALVDTPLHTWRSYLRWRVLDTFAPALPARFENASFDFRGRILGGAQTQLPRWKRCVNATDVALGEAVGKAYVARLFPPAAKARAQGMTLRIKRAYRAELSALRWMTPATKRIAIAKLDAMGLKVGYPAIWRSYAGYVVRPDSFFANVEAGQAFERRYELAMIGRPVNRAQWFMTPQTVNAYNDTQRNEIVLPAAQLQRPFYDPAADDAANLGATGAGTVGHETTHGFDDVGREFDAQGNVRNWWTPHDLHQFNARAQCVIRQFDRAVAIGSVHYQGRLVAGEAIADLGGVVIGYRALESSLGPKRTTIDGYTPEQRYFLAFAQSWSETVRPEAARVQALTDPHPLPRDRVNQTLANVPAWYAAFACPKPPKAVCEIW